MAMEVIPAVLSNSKEEISSQLEFAKSTGFGRVQVDFVDEAFSNQTVPVALVDVNKYKDMRFDAHLMLSTETVWEEIAMAKINGFSRIIVQVESVDDTDRFIQETKDIERGLAVDLSTGLGEVEMGVLGQVDVILLMAVEAGFGGQMFDNRVINKIKVLQSLRLEKKYKFRICVDGGVEKLHIPVLEELGVDEIAVGLKRLISWQKKS